MTPTAPIPTERQEHLAAVTRAILDKWHEMMPEPKGGDVAVIFATLGMLLLGQMPLRSALNILMMLGNQLIAESEAGPSGPMEVN